MLPIRDQGNNRKLSLDILLPGVDRESSLWQLTHIITQPSAVHRLIRTHRHTRGKWGRGDVAFLFLESLCVLGIGVLHFILFSIHTRKQFLKSILSFVAGDYLLAGVILSTICFIVLNKWGRTPPTTHSAEQEVEWKYCLDVFCLAYTTFILDVDAPLTVLFCIQRFIANYFTQVFLPYLALCFGLCHFIYIFIPCIQVLPFVKKIPITPMLILPLLPFVISLIMAKPLKPLWCSWHF